MLRRLRPRRPSPAMLVAITALIVAVGGTAFAEPIARMMSGDRVIKKRSLSGDRLRNHTLTAKQIDVAELGLQQRVRWAIVDDDGRITAQSGGIVNDVHDPDSCPAGCDFLNFGSSQEDKAILVTPNTVERVMSASLCGGPDDAPTTAPETVCSINNDPKFVLVRATVHRTGEPADSPYFIAVIG